MKIYQVCPFFFPVKGGMEEHVRQISLLLKKKGYNVTVLTSDSSRDGYIKKRVETIDDISVFRFKTLISLGDFGKFWPGFILKLIKDDYDIVHVHNYRHIHTILAAIICFLRRKPCILTTHSPFHPLYLRRFLSKMLVFVYDRFLKFFIDPLFSKIILITSSEKKYFKHVSPRKLVSIPNGVENEMFKKVSSRLKKKIKRKYGLKDSEKKILYVGRIHPTKGIDFLLKVLKELIKKDKKYKLVIAGPLAKTRYFSSLLNFIKKNGLEKHIVFTGFVSGEGKIGLYDVCDLFFLPTKYESFGIVMLESFARGKPVVSVDSDGPRYLVKEGVNGFLVRYGDVDSAVNYIETLVQNKGLYKKISSNNREKAREFVWDKIVDKLIKVYEEVLSKNR